MMLVAAAIAARRSPTVTHTQPKAPVSIWWFAFGYFACYVPYSALAKALSDGLLPGMEDSLHYRLVEGFDGRVTGLMLLPISCIASMVGMFIFLSARRWWKFATHRQLFARSIPMPTRWTFLSGIATAGIIATTTLSYTFTGVSIVFMMLLMRGGVLVIAPLVDAVTGRRVSVPSWVALALSLGALLVAFFGAGRTGTAMTIVAVVDVLIYLLAYFFRLRFMSRLAKSHDPDATRRYFVEEQMTATPAIVLFLGILALVGEGSWADQLRVGFTELWLHPELLWIIVVGILSQGTGIFGALVLLDSRENSFCVPVNRASSILAGLVASAGLSLFLQVDAPAASEFHGATRVIAAILVLSLQRPLSAWWASRRQQPR
jgi:hypothetical protein